MDVKKIIGIGLFCGLSLNGSASISPVSYSAGGFSPASLGCFPGANCRELEEFQGIAQEVINKIHILVGDNPTSGQMLAAPMLAFAFSCYNMLNQRQDIVAKLYDAFNGRLPLRQLQEFREDLDAAGNDVLIEFQNILDAVYPSLLKEAIPVLQQVLPQLPQMLQEKLPYIMNDLKALKY
ncbi:MAG: hypothetical protein LBR92_04595 [Puniceicoccales bacterium]|jgi:hypothetical protein|nr:hypothetical protein [Puniceicoccales bacterium]